MACATIHLPLHRLEAIDLPLDRARAPGCGDGRTNGLQIAGEALREAGQLAVSCSNEPIIEIRCVTAADQGGEASCQVRGGAERGYGVCDVANEVTLIRRHLDLPWESGERLLNYAVASKAQGL